MRYPKLLIVSRLNWDDNSVSNTLTNLFSDYDPDKIARIYIETQQPNTKCCHHFYQISEFSLIKKFWQWGLKTGRIIDTDDGENNSMNDDKTANQETFVMNYVRSHRSWLFSVFREILWLFGGWKTRELKKFIIDFDPDVVWLDGSPLILMNRLNNYVYKVAKKPMVTFLMDDVYCYESCVSFFDRIYKYFLRKYVKWTVDHSHHVFVASQKMKEEYDLMFGVNSSFITKSFDTDMLKSHVDRINKPVKMVYLGNVLIGRLNSLIYVAECMKEINKNGQRLQLSIYTNSFISKKDKKRILIDDGVRLYPPVAYNEVPEIIAGSDVLVFTESLDGKNMSVARLSFSTKIIDYIQSGKCILAVGPKDVAPIEYFRNEDAALVASSKEELMAKLMQLTDETVIRKYAEKAIVCGKRNHDKIRMHKRIYSIIRNVAKSNIRRSNN
ncbi:MAG TPA: hypothetical protein H9984_10775 [Candidatus Parabacteroides faecavium]|nr:hypothetical protein [Candidatus Parabacteroides faecavium]